MKTKNHLVTIGKTIGACLLCCNLVAPLASCSSDDDDNNSTDSKEITQYDDLAFFQDAIVEIDSTGVFLGRHYGVPLYPNDTTHLYIGVDSLAQAEQMFRLWLAPDIKPTTDIPTTSGIVCPLTDPDGKAQGTLYFRPSTESGNVAEVTVSSDTQLNHFSRITFMLNSAWPQNSASSKWHVFDIVKNVTPSEIAGKLDAADKSLNWVCIREAGNGVQPMFCAITNSTYSNPLANWNFYAYTSPIRKSKYCPNLSTAQAIQQILAKDWDLFVAIFDEAGSGKLGGGGYWIDDGSFSEGGSY